MTGSTFHPFGIYPLPEGANHPPERPNPHDGAPFSSPVGHAGLGEPAVLPPEEGEQGAPSVPYDCG